MPMVWLWALFIAGAVTACQTTVVPLKSVVCPPLVEYTQAQRDKMAQELEVLGSGATLGMAMADYASLRAQIRVCRGES